MGTSKVTFREYIDFTSDWAVPIKMMIEFSHEILRKSKMLASIEWDCPRAQRSGEVSLKIQLTDRAGSNSIDKVERVVNIYDGPYYPKAWKNTRQGRGR